MPPNAPHLPLGKKLGIKPGHTVILLHAPQSIIATLGAELKQVMIQQMPGTNADVVHAFLTSKKDLEESFVSLRDQMARHGALWISWPKKSSGMETDLAEGVIRDIAIHNHLTDVKICSVDEIWSGLKFVYRLKDR